jgi:hypothetical protein
MVLLDSSINIYMADQITKILIRSGTTATKDAIILAEAELGYAIDSKKVWVGDGNTPGGNIVGQKFYISDLGADLNENNTLSYAVSGDLVYDLQDNCLKALSGTNNLQEDNYFLLVDPALSGTVTEISVGQGLMVNVDPTASIITTGTINIDVDSVTSGSKPEILQKSADGIKADWDVIYPTTSILYTTLNVNPIAFGPPPGVLYGTSQVWEAAGTVTTLGTGGATIYAWKRTG